MDIYSNKQGITEHISQLKEEGFTIGFVPTMGALHAGHGMLVKQALIDNDYVVVSVFVNPTQFDNNADLETYPRTLDDDASLLKSISDTNILLYTPSVNDIYEDNLTSESFNFEGLEFEMEGEFRHGHFNGVATVLKRFFNILKPNKAYFGEKDFQQLCIVKKLVEKYHIPVLIESCEIHREDDGLAMSSRNKRLKPEYRASAPLIYQVLSEVKSRFKDSSIPNIAQWVENQFRKAPHLELEYFIIADISTLKKTNFKAPSQRYRAFIAAYADDVRLIDNIPLN